MAHQQSKTKEKPKPKLHPAAESWNAFLGKMEEAREAWQEHHKVYLSNKRSIQNLSPHTRKMLSGIHHRQFRFDHVLDFIMRYGRTGFDQIIIKE